MYEYLNLSKSFAKTPNLNVRSWFSLHKGRTVNIGGKYNFDNKKWYMKKGRYKMRMNKKSHSSQRYNLYRLINGCRQ